MKDITQTAIIELRQILSQQIIPQVSAQESLRMILAQRPFHLPPDIRAKRRPAPGLKMDGKLKSGLFLAQDKKEAMHAIRVPYLCYVMEGEIDMRLGIPRRQGKSRGVVNNYDILTLPAGSLLFIPPGVFFPKTGLLWERAPLQPVDTHLFWIHVFPTGARCHTGATRKGIYTNDNYDVFVPDIKLAMAAELLQDELQSSDEDSNQSALNALLVFLFRLRRGLGKDAAISKGQLSIAPTTDAALSVNSAIIERACYYIQLNRGEPLSIEKIADHAYVSPSHLTKLFRTELKTTVKKYVLDQRMEAARLMLTSTEISIQEIARFTGYMQPPQFNKVFKQIHHVTPKEFRQRFYGSTK